MKKLLLVIDMQIDFIDGALGTPEAEAIVDKVVEKMKTYPTANIIATRDTHTPDYLHPGHPRLAAPSGSGGSAGGGADHG